MDNNSQEIEEWRSIEGYENLYEISSLGRVRSLDRYVDNGKGGIMLLKGRVLKPGKDGGGYLLVILSKDGKPTAFIVHRLVYEAFYGKIPEGMQVNHIDENKSNNTIDNLNVMTSKENINWGTGNERRSKSHINHKALSKAVVQYDLQGNFIAEYPSVAEAGRKLGINLGNISSALKGRIKTAGGYIFHYKTA